MWSCPSVSEQTPNSDEKRQLNVMGSNSKQLFNLRRVSEDQVVQLVAQTITIFGHKRTILGSIIEVS